MAAETPDDLNASQSNLAVLQLRLRRLEFLLTGSTTPDGIPDGIRAPKKSDDTVTAKLTELQAALDGLRRLDGTAGSLVREMEALRASIHDQI
jgi:hypothetical protein